MKALEVRLIFKIKTGKKTKIKDTQTQKQSKTNKRFYVCFISPILIIHSAFNHAHYHLKRLLGNAAFNF